MRHGISLLLFILSSTYVSAGVFYKAVTESDGQNQDVVVSSWIDGDKAKILFEESENPMAKNGSYVITTDAGKTMYLVNPEDKTYMKWDLNQMINMAGNMMESMGGMVDMSFDNVDVKQLAKTPGEKMQGYATTFYKYQTTYDLNVKMFGMKRSQSSESVQEMWVTDRLNDAAMNVWLTKEPPSSGNEDLNKLIKAEMSKMKGFPLKSVVTTTVKSYNKKRTKVKKQQTTTTTTTVTELKKTAIPAKTFVIPDDYELVDPMAGASEEEGGNPFKSIFGKKN